MRVFEAVLHHARTAAGDVSPLHFRLRAGDYRVFFTVQSEEIMIISRVRHRSHAYR